MKQKLLLLGVTSDSIDGKIKELMEKEHRLDFIKLSYVFKAGKSMLFLSVNNDIMKTN